MTNDLLILAMQRLNEALTAATVIVAASMLFYNLTHGLHDRVVRASSGLLGCVTVTYIGDILGTLSNNPASIDAWQRFQWIGIAFAPAALFHVSDALLSTTGLISRGRRRRVTRILYLFSIVFLLTAVFTDLIVGNLTLRPMPMMQAGPLFWLYIAFFAITTLFAVNNVLRARRRCLTTATHRRMTYLLFVFVTPAAGIFPYSLLFPNPSQASPTLLWLLVNIGNLGIVLMLTFFAYPLSFFGSQRPDRVVKAELLRFMLRGPVTATLVLLIILFVPATRVFGLPGPEFMPFAAVASVLFLQWAFTVIIPVLERWLIYTKDREQAQWVRDFSERLMTHEDAQQLLEATLAAVCDYLRVPSAFVASVGSQGARLEQVIGPLLPSQTWLSSPEFMALAADTSNMTHDLPEGMQIHGNMLVWQSFWLVPLHSIRETTRDNHANGSNGTNGGNGGGNGNGDKPTPQHGPLIGVLGVWARSSQPDLADEEQAVFDALCSRAAIVLDGARLQEELFTNFENILRETSAVQSAISPIRYNASSLPRNSTGQGEVLAPPDFIDLIKDALRDYYGGPRLTDKRLLDLKIVVRALDENGNNPARAVRAVLGRAIESLKPEGQRSMTAAEWILYNILELRFVQGRKVRDVATKLAMSEADLFRKQKLAIVQVANKIIEMETVHESDEAATTTN